MDTGHGGSDGLHGYVESLDHVVADTVRYFSWILMFQTKFCLLFGDSDTF